MSEFLWVLKFGAVGRLKKKNKIKAGTSVFEKSCSTSKNFAGFCYIAFWFFAINRENANKLVSQANESLANQGRKEGRKGSLLGALNLLKVEYIQL